ncbi:3381_t:CDS:1, partial [Gigaspora rosea]
MQMIKARQNQVQFIRAIRDKNGEPIATRWDILNLSPYIHISEENAPMEALILDIEKREYTINHKNQN